MTEANITIEEISSHLKVAHISGQLDESNIDDKIQAVYKTIEATPIHLGLIFDLAELDYMNSKSIGYMTDIYGKITENGGKVVISSAKSNIADILDVVGLTQLINIYDNVELAKLKVTEALPKENISAQPVATQQITPVQPITVQQAEPTTVQQPQVAPIQPATVQQPQTVQIPQSTTVESAAAPQAQFSETPLSESANKIQL